MATRPKPKRKPVKKAAAPPAPKQRPATPQRSAASTAAAPAPARAERPQAEVFERAIKLFSSRDYLGAKRLFETVAAGPDRAMAHAAIVRAEMCSRRIAAAEPPLRGADEHYDYAVALINARRLAQAERHLMTAAAMAPRADHIYYALALCRGLAGDVRGACVNLKRAIELQPRNRMNARNDPDFADLVRLSPIAELLYP